MSQKHDNNGTRPHNDAHLSPGELGCFRVHKTNKKRSMTLLGFNLSKLAKKGDQTFKVMQMAGQGLMLHYALANAAAGMAWAAGLNGGRQFAWHRLQGSEAVKRKMRKKSTRRKIETFITAFASASSVPQVIDPESSPLDIAAASCAVLAYGELSAAPWMQLCRKVKARNITRAIFNTQREITQQIGTVKSSHSTVVGITPEIDEKLKKINGLNEKSEKFEQRITRAYTADLIAGSLLFLRGGLQFMAGLVKVTSGNPSGYSSMAAGTLFMAGGGFMFLNKLGERNERINRAHERFSHQKAELALGISPKQCTLPSTPHSTLQAKPT